MSEIPLEEIPFAETFFFLETHLSPYRHELWAGLPKQFKKVVNNDSSEAYKINLKVLISKIKNHQISCEQSELFDDIIDHPEKYNKD
ncbi:MAG: hypothetical protein H7Z73_08455 [Candidatus Saccharibacteria bacterium]|nr:hypothetical protein [Moraxellaceae bacterium]